MSNALARLIDLLPKEAEFVGTITSAEHPIYKVLVVDGSGLVICTSNAKYDRGARVFISGNEIKRVALEGPVIELEI